MFNKVSIIGCGLIGSSILRAVEEKKLASKISVFDNSNRVMEYLKKNFSVNICSNVSEAAKDADLIIMTNRVIKNNNKLTNCFDKYDGKNLSVVKRGGSILSTIRKIK